MKRSYSFEINVSSADELAGMGGQLTEFMREIGEADGVDVKVLIGHGEFCVNTHAIGFEVYDDEEDG